MDNNFMKRLTQHNLTKSQMKIADYVAKNQKRIVGLTAKQAGGEIGVSDATMIRFARALDYEGYTDLQIKLSEELQKKKEKIGKHSLFDRYTMQMEKYNTDDHNGSDMLYLMGINLETSLRQNSAEIYESIVDGILQAKRKVIIGLRGGRGCALQFARLLSHVTDNVDCIIEEGHDQINKLAELGERDAVLILNFPRYYKIDEKIGSIISENHVPCFLITDSMMSPTAKYAQQILLVETEHCGFFHSMIGVEGVLEYLMILMCWRNPEIFRKRLQARDRILEEYRIE